MEEDLKQRVLAVPLDDVPLFLARLDHYLTMHNRAIVNPYLSDHLRGEDADLRGHWLNELTFRATQQLVGTIGPNPTFGYPYSVFADTLFDFCRVRFSVR